MRARFLRRLREPGRAHHERVVVDVADPQGAPQLRSRGGPWLHERRRLERVGVIDHPALRAQQLGRNLQPGRRLSHLEQLRGVGAHHRLAHRGAEPRRLADQVVIGVGDQVFVGHIAVSERRMRRATNRDTPPGSRRSASDGPAPGRGPPPRPPGDPCRRGSARTGRRRSTAPPAPAAGDRPRTWRSRSRRASGRPALHARARSGRAQRAGPARTPPSHTGRGAHSTPRVRGDQAPVVPPGRRVPRATASQQWLLAVMPWTATTGSTPSGPEPSLNVASIPPATGTSALSIADKSLSVHGGDQLGSVRARSGSSRRNLRLPRTCEVQPRPGAGEQERAQRPTERGGLQADVLEPGGEDHECDHRTDVAVGDRRGQQSSRRGRPARSR